MKGTRLNEDWRPDTGLYAWAKGRRTDLNIDEQVEMFLDYWCAKAGQGATKLDWNRTFRNWIRSARAAPASFRAASGAKPVYKVEQRQRVTVEPQAMKDLLALMGIKS